jgi:putative transcriptional regulator
VVNRPTTVPVADVLPSWQPFTTDPSVLFHGGPVAVDSALGLAVLPGQGQAEPLGWRRVVDGLGLIDLDAPPEMLAPDMADLRIFAGYAGWGTGQLEDELAENAWSSCPAGPRRVQPGPRVAVARRAAPPGWQLMVSTYPDDPTLN